MLSCILTLTPNPVSDKANPPAKGLVATATAYCLKGHTTSGPRTSQVKGGCIALSRKLAKDLGLYIGPGQYDYHFGIRIHVSGIGSFTFADLMPKKWDRVGTGYRIDIWIPGYKKALAFGIKRARVRVVRK